MYTIQQKYMTGLSVSLSNKTITDRKVVYTTIRKEGGQAVLGPWRTRWFALWKCMMFYFKKTYQISFPWRSLNIRRVFWSREKTTANKPPLTKMRQHIERNESSSYKGMRGERKKKKNPRSFHNPIRSTIIANRRQVYRCADLLAQNCLSFIAFSWFECRYRYGLMNSNY